MSTNQFQTKVGLYDVYVLVTKTANTYITWVVGIERIKKKGFRKNLFRAFIFHWRVQVQIYTKLTFITLAYYKI